MKKEYFLRLQKILKLEMHGDKFMTVICAYTVPVLCYTFGVMKWTKRELKIWMSKPENFRPLMASIILRPISTAYIFICKGRNGPHWTRGHP
eukprot:8902289-Ditylum_brightwellii.AAC.1